jgi:hypothetical protein
MSANCSEKKFLEYIEEVKPVAHKLIDSLEPEWTWYVIAEQLVHVYKHVDMFYLSLPVDVFGLLTHRVIPKIVELR